MTRSVLKPAACMLALLGVTAALPANAESPKEFYSKNRLTLIVGAGAGGGYDLYARVLFAHMPQHIPGNPTAVVQNMAGAGGAKAANYLANVSPKDGSAIGMPLGSTVLRQVLRPKKIKFKAEKFGWIGTITTTTDVLGIRADAGIKTLDDAKKKEIIIGSTSKLSQTHLQPALVNKLLGTKFRIVQGYKSGRTLNLALDRKEIQGRTNPWISWITQKGAMIRNHKVNFVVQYGPKVADLPKVPRFLDLVKDPKKRAMVELLEIMQFTGRSIMAPEGIPKDRLATLRKAFDDTMKDPAFLADAKSKKMIVNPRSGADLQADMIRIMGSAKPTADNLKTILSLK